EAERLDPAAREFATQAGALERSPEFNFLGGVAEPGEPDPADPRRLDHAKDGADRLRAADRYDRRAFGSQVPPASRGKRLQRHLVAAALDQDERRYALKLEHYAKVAPRIRAGIVEKRVRHSVLITRSVPPTLHRGGGAASAGRCRPNPSTVRADPV